DWSSDVCSSDLAGHCPRLIETQHICIAARGTKIAHPTADERHTFAIGRHCRCGQLFARSRCKHHASLRLLERVQLGQPPLTIAIPWCRSTYESAAGQEIEFIDIKIRGREKFE